MKTEFRLYDWKQRPLLPSSDPLPPAAGVLDHGYADGVRAFCEGDFAAARRRFTACLATQPSSPLILAALGHTFLHDGNPDKAEEHYERAAGLKSDLPDVAYNRALLSMGGGRWAQAIPALGGLYSSPGEVRRGQFYFGLLFATREELLCEIALHLGSCHEQLGKSQEAREWYARALKHDTHCVVAHQRLSELDIRNHNYLSAIGHLRAVLELSPLDDDQVHAHNNLGVACYENGMMDEAISHLTWVLRKAPGNRSAVHNLNYIYEAEGFFVEESSPTYSIRLVDVKEGASPIFGLAREKPAGESEESGPVVVGRSQAMMRVMRHARVAAASDAPVLITGGAGTGKELLARVIARNSARRDAPFRVMSCAGKPELLLESELFGHEKGAFTGARVPRAGMLEVCSGGTLLLKEVEALTPLLQGRLARAIREERFSPMGSTRELSYRVRLITATAAPLAEHLRARSFREELYYQLSVVPIEVPLLRDRVEDIPLLVEYFLQRHARRTGSANPPTLGAEDMGVLMEYEWPGNVRELENLIARAVIMGTQSSLYLEELARLRRERAEDRRTSPAQEPDGQVTYPTDISLADLERRHIQTVLDLYKHNQRKAAQVLGINPSTLWRKLKSYEEGGEDL